jgi:hypothetical protein
MEMDGSDPPHLGPSHSTATQPQSQSHQTQQNEQQLRQNDFNDEAFNSKRRPRPPNKKKKKMEPSTQQQSQTLISEGQQQQQQPRRKSHPRSVSNNNIQESGSSSMGVNPSKEVNPSSGISSKSTTNSERKPRIRHKKKHDATGAINNDTEETPKPSGEVKISVQGLNDAVRPSTLGKRQPQQYVAPPSAHMDKSLNGPHQRSRLKNSNPSESNLRAVSTSSHTILDPKTRFLDSISSSKHEKNDANSGAASTTSTPRDDTSARSSVSSMRAATGRKPPPPTYQHNETGSADRGAGRQRGGKHRLKGKEHANGNTGTISNVKTSGTKASWRDRDLPSEAVVVQGNKALGPRTPSARNSIASSDVAANHAPKSEENKENESVQAGESQEQTPALLVDEILKTPSSQKERNQKRDKRDYNTPRGRDVQTSRQSEKKVVFEE